MSKYIQGTAFYLFFYIIIGFVNSIIVYLCEKFTNINPKIVLAILIIPTVLVLFWSFKKSLEVVFGEEFEREKVLFAWILQVITFVVVATFGEIGLSKLIGNPKVLRVAYVFSNFVVFFFTYWLFVRIVVVGKKFEA
jgi:hypothetical protein